MVTEKQVLEAVVALNASGLIKEEVGIVGISFEDLKNNFLSAVETIREEDTGKIPNIVGVINNALIDEEEIALQHLKSIAESGEKEVLKETKAKKEVKPKKEKEKKDTVRVKGPSKTSDVADLLKDGKSVDDICTYMTSKYGEKTGSKRNVMMYIKNIKKAGGNG